MEPTTVLRQVRAKCKLPPWTKQDLIIARDMAYAEFRVSLHLQLLIIFMYIVDLAAVIYHSLLGFAVAFFIRCADELLIKKKSLHSSVWKHCESHSLTAFPCRCSKTPMYPAWKQVQTQVQCLCTLFYSAVNTALVSSSPRNRANNLLTLSTPTLKAFCEKRCIAAFCFSSYIHIASLITLKVWSWKSFCCMHSFLFPQAIGWQLEY